MFKSTLLDFKSAGTLNKLVFDYLENEPALREFYGPFPDRKGFGDLLKQKPYVDLDRSLLAETLLTQSRRVANTNELSLANIELLKNKNTYTITTGHQLCLFTGPLYFLYKIFSTINLAECLKKQFPEFDFVPVYWMASEDHDFEEVSSFHSNGRTVKWASEQKGMVGDFKTAELKKLLPELRAAFGISDNANYLFGLFENAYLKNEDLATATLYLVNELFGKYGLVTIDGNDPAFKTQLKSVFRKDIFENIPAKAVNESIKKLEALGHHVQVNPRDINCFFVDEQLRARIEKAGDRYQVVGSEKQFSSGELEQLIDMEPWKISPNVVLRPVFQQLILPNIAYVGGPGELAYWLELKAMFTELGVFFPILVPRNFLSIVDAGTKHKIDQLKFFESDFFKAETDLVKEFMLRNNQVFDTPEEEKKLKEIFSQLVERTNRFDRTLEANVLAELQRSLKRLKSIASKSNKALKKNAETELNRIRAVKQALFPNETPQERYENFSSLYIRYGPALFETLKNQIDPFTHAHQILTEENYEK